MTVTALDAGVAGQAVAVVGGATAQPLSDRLATAGARVLSRESLGEVPDRDDDAVVGGWLVVVERLASPRAVAALLTQLASSLDGAEAVRRVVLLVVDDAPAAGALARTAAIYATVHTLRRDVRVNVVVAPSGALADAADVALVFLAGWLDAVRGQTFVVDTQEAA